MTTSTQDRDPRVFVPHPPIVIHLKSVLNLSDEQLFRLSQSNPSLRIERNDRGEVIIMSPTGGETGEQNAEITMQLRMWAKRDGTGATFDSSTGFRLPDGAVRSPDGAWVLNSRLNQLTREQRKGFIPLCPDFVIELCSPSDNLTELQKKMQEYIENGAQLGWLLDTERRCVYVYQPGVAVKTLEDPATLLGDPILISFELDLKEIW